MGKVVRGVFGRQCEECDNIIPRARIQMMPKAKLCVECQTAEEGRRKRSLQRAMLVARNQDTVIIRG